jgi:hypothetical protein
MSGLGAVIMLAICGLSGFFVVADERRGHSDEATRGEPPVDTPAVDATPLRLEQVFPGNTIRMGSDAASYAVAVAHIDEHCDTATVGALGPVLQEHGCSQVIRAALTAPYAGYQVTAGVFTMADAAGAARAAEQARLLVETGSGSFDAFGSATLAATPLDALARPPAQVGWHEVDHFLVFCVISRPDGAVIRDDDPVARRITVDLVESYLGEQVLSPLTQSP